MRRPLPTRRADQVDSEDRRVGDLTFAADSPETSPAGETRPLRLSVPPVCILLRGSVVIPEVVALSRAMLRDGRFEPVVVTMSGEAADAVRSATTSDLRAVRLDGAPHGRFPGARRNDVTSAAFRKNARHRLKRIVLNFRPLHAPILWRGLGADLRAASELIERIRPVAVATYSDRTPRPDMALLATARRARVPTVLLPFATSTRESDAYVRREATYLRLDRGPLAMARRAFARRNPRHAMDTEYGRMLFFSLWDCFALAAHRLHGTSPWVVGGGEVDLVAVGSMEDLDTALSHGLSGEHMRVTGQASLDALHRSRSGRNVVRAALRASYGLRHDRPIALCAVPHSAEHGLRSWSEHRGRHPGLVSSAERERCRRTAVPAPEIGTRRLSGIGESIRTQGRDRTAPRHSSRGGILRRRIFEHRTLVRRAWNSDRHLRSGPNRIQNVRRLAECSETDERSPILGV